MASVVEAVVMVAQGDEVGGVGGPAVFPMGDVMALEPAGALAARHPTSAVSLLHHHPGALGDGAKRPAHAERPPGPLPHRHHRGVADQVAAQALGQGRAQVEMGMGLTEAVGVEVHQHPVAVTVGTLGASLTSERSAMLTMTSAQVSGLPLASSAWRSAKRAWRRSARARSHSAPSSGLSRADSRQ